MPGWAQATGRPLGPHPAHRLVVPGAERLVKGLVCGQDKPFRRDGAPRRSCSDHAPRPARAQEPRRRRLARSTLRLGATRLGRALAPLMEDELRPVHQLDAGRVELLERRDAEVVHAPVLFHGAAPGPSARGRASRLPCRSGTTVGAGSCATPLARLPARTRASIAGPRSRSRPSTVSVTAPRQQPRSGVHDRPRRSTEAFRITNLLVVRRHQRACESPMSSTMPCGPDGDLVPELKVLEEETSTPSSKLLRLLGASPTARPAEATTATRLVVWMPTVLHRRDERRREHG